MALTGQNKRVYDGSAVTLDDLRQLNTDTADWAGTSRVHFNVDVSGGEVRIIVDQASV